MTLLREIYKCDVCGNVVEVVHQGPGQLICCNQPMEKLELKTEDKGMEKHVPAVKEVSGGIEVAVGDVHHPMEEKHYIKFIEVLTSDKVLRAELGVDQVPVVQFNISLADVDEVRSYCNIHGLWTYKNSK